MEIIRKDENGIEIAKIIFGKGLVQRIDVDENHRRQGIAWGLLTEATDKLREMGESEVQIVAEYDTPIGIENLIKFYEDFGFSVDNNSEVHNIIMEMEL